MKKIGSLSLLEEKKKSLVQIGNKILISLNVQEFQVIANRTLCILRLDK